MTGGRAHAQGRPVFLLDRVLHPTACPNHFAHLCLDFSNRGICACASSFPEALTPPFWPLHNNSGVDVRGSFTSACGRANQAAGGVRPDLNISHPDLTNENIRRGGVTTATFLHPRPRPHLCSPVRRTAAAQLQHYRQHSWGSESDGVANGPEKIQSAAHSLLCPSWLSSPWHLGDWPGSTKPALPERPLSSVGLAHPSQQVKSEGICTSFEWREAGGQGQDKQPQGRPHV